MKISGFLGLTAFLTKYIFACFVSLDENLVFASTVAVAVCRSEKLN